MPQKNAAGRRIAIKLTAALLVGGGCLFLFFGTGILKNRPLLSFRPNLPEFADPGPVPPALADPMLQIHFDRRVELLSLIFRLAGNAEFNRCRLPAFDRRIRDRFAGFASHPAVRLGAEFSRANLVGYDAVSSFAVNLTDTDTLELTAPEKIDGRWPRDRIPEFLAALRDFVKASGFNQFIAEERNLYGSYENRTARLVADAGIGAWAVKNLGRSDRRTFIVVPALQNGPNNYGARMQTPDTETFYAIIGIDPEYDQPSRKSGTVGLVVHEFMHSFVNPMVDQHYPELKPAAERLFPAVKEQLKKQGYNNPHTMMYESLVRAATALYMLDAAGEAAFKREVAKQQKLGFRWLDQLTARLIAERRKHPGDWKMEDGFPACIEVLNAYQLPQN